MQIGAHTVRYTIHFSDEPLVWTIDLSKKKWASDPDALPDWTKLEFRQCKCCPLKTETAPHCPAAICAHEVLTTFRNARSFETVKVEVETPHREYRKELPLQDALQSLLGLLMSTSGCPVLERFRPMANFHMPFASLEETLFRTVGSYLIHQYFEEKDDRDPDWKLEGLIEFHRLLEELNRDFTERIRSIEENDAISNALIIFFSTSAIVADSIEDGLEDYRRIFTNKLPWK